MNYLSYSKTIESYPLPETDIFRNTISGLLKRNRIKIVVLDDDPTGIQTVHDCLLLTQWNVKNLIRAFEDKASFFYILTNSRSVHPEEAGRINEDVVNNIIRVNKSYNYRLIFVSRSDSTLRGHFPLEPDIISSVIEFNHLPLHFPTFFIPCLLEAGRYTIKNVHYFRDKDRLIPVAKTEFAKDNVFGFTSSNLIEYIIEKSGNKTANNRIGSISIHDLRNNPVENIMDIIYSMKNAEYIIVNALNYYDLRKFSIAILQLLSETTSNLVFRTSSSFPKAISGIKDKLLLTGKELVRKKGIGIFIIGSHVAKTTLQLNKLLEEKGVQDLELDIAEILKNPDGLLNKSILTIKGSVTKGITPVIYTSREEMRSEDKKERLHFGKKISDFLVSIVKNLPVNPTYLVSKGGITSNDILTLGLNIESARVIGQIIPGVPVIMTDKSNKYPRLPYIIFPGNVGDEYSLQAVFNTLK